MLYECQVAFLGIFEDFYVVLPRRYTLSRDKLSIQSIRF